MALGSDPGRGTVTRAGRPPHPANTVRVRDIPVAPVAPVAPITPVFLIVLALLLVPALAGCGDASGGAEESPPPVPSAEPATTAATAPADPSAARTEIARNWERFFDPASTPKEKQAVLEDGDTMGPVLRSFGGDARGGQVRAEVTDVRFTGAERATVSYALLLKGATALPDATGTAVEQDGTWKMTVATLCALVELSGDASRSPAAGC
jgi:hypothetical protein